MKAALEPLLRGTGLGLNFAELARRGTVWDHPQPRIQFEAFRFPTPSGRIELASDRAQDDGHPRVAQPLADARPTGGRLRPLTPASSWMLNHSFANEPKIAPRVGWQRWHCTRSTPPKGALGQGDRAVLRSSAGELELSVLLSQSLPRGVAFSPKGALAGAGGSGRQRQRPEPWHPERHGSVHDRARDRSEHCTGRLSPGTL